MHSPSHIYIRKSIENTEKNPYLFSYLLYYTYSYYYSMQHFPGRARLYVIKEEDSLLFFLAYFFHSSKRTLKRPVFFNCSFSAIHHFPSLFFVTFWLFRNTSLGKKKQTKNMQHRSSNADTIRAESEKVRQANEERLREKRMVRRRLISFFSKLSLFVTFVELFD